MAYISQVSKTEHYTEGEFDAFGPDGMRMPEVKAVTIRASAIRGREEHRRGNESASKGAEERS